MFFVFAHANHCVFYGYGFFQFVPSFYVMLFGCLLLCVSFFVCMCSTVLVCATFSFPTLIYVTIQFQLCARCYISSLTYICYRLLFAYVLCLHVLHVLVFRFFFLYVLVVVTLCGQLLCLCLCCGRARAVDRI